MTTATQALGWALVHFVWQGALMALALAGLLRLTRRADAGTRYLLSVGTLGVMLALPVATAVRAYRSATTDFWTAPAAAHVPTARPLPAVRQEPRATGAVDRPAGPAPDASASPSPPGDVPPFTAPRPTLGERLEPLLPTCVVIWFVGVLLLSFRLLGAWLHAQRFRSSGTAPAPAACLAAVRRLMDRLGVRRAVEVLQSTAVSVPAVIGAVRPVLLVPASVLTGLTPQQLEVLLAHELAHVRRHDYLVNLVQSVVETLLFYHPAVWWVSGRVRAEREHCCDDLAVALCGDRELYVRALVGLEELRGAPALAAAASGGSLLGRARRLLAPALPRADATPRWQAGAIALAAALGLGVPSLAAPPAETPEGSPAAQTDTVMIHPDPSQPLAGRWAWAAERARALGAPAYWVGYRVAKNPAIGGLLWVDRHVRITGDDITLSGRISGDFDGLRLPGASLLPLIHEAPSDDLVQLLGFTGRDLRRVHVASITLPVDLEGRPLFWLGAAADSESVPLLARLFGDAPDLDIKTELVDAVGVHATASATVPVLVDWLESREPAEVRTEAAEWLAMQAHPAALAALARAARTDRSSEVRREAAEGAPTVPIQGAVDTGMALARTLTDDEARREAVESLGELGDPRSLAALIEIARSEGDPDVAREAVESLGDRPDGEGVAGLLELARMHAVSDVRREAVETLAAAMPAERVAPVLRDVARNDRDGDVQREAVETLGELEGGAGVAVLLELLRTHDVSDVRREVVETLGEALPADSALVILRDLAVNDPDGDVQREAVETMGDLEGGSAAPALLGVARAHPRPDVRREAVETLAETLDPGPAVDALRDIVRDDADVDVKREAVQALGNLDDRRALALLAELARTHPHEDVRGEALDVYSDGAPPDSASALLRELAASDPSEGVREDALEALGDLEGGAGIPALIDIARATNDRDVRARVLEILSRSDDPRAVELIKRMLEVRE
jgi:HEAT repeat protein/beta-lactamase regulating signal transducer with metallopeptidase domain